MVSDFQGEKMKSRTTFKQMLISALLCGLFVSSCSGFRDEAESDQNSAELAEDILLSLNRPAGLVYFPNAGDGTLAFEFLKADSLLRIYAQDTDYEKVQAARVSADEMGEYGRRAWFDQGCLRKFIPAGNSCDLVIIENLEMNEMTAELASEISRVLHPWYGTAYVSANVLEFELQKWGTSFSGEVTADPELSLLAGRPFLKLTKGKPKGTDNWPQWWHGPDNNPVSNDTAFQLPETLQWTGKPFFSTRVELPIVSDGILFTIWNGHEMDMSPGNPLLNGLEGEGPLLIAQSTGSGVRLWAQRLSPAAWVQISRSIMVADRDVLLVADGNCIREINKHTGNLLSEITTDCGEIKWMCRSGDALFVLGGTITENFGHRAPEAVIPFRKSGLNLIAFNWPEMSVRWRVDRETDVDAFDPRSPAIDGDTLFICSEEDYIEAFSIEDGEQRWGVTGGFTRNDPHTYEWDRSSRHPVTGYAVYGIYMVSGTEMDYAHAFSQSDGTLLWTSPTPDHYQSMPMAFDGLLYRGGKGYNPLTGEQENVLGKVQKGGCSRYTAAPAGIIGTCGITFDRISEISTNILSAKSACGPGQYVADGLQWKFPSPCVGCTEWRGFAVRGAAEEVPEAGERLCVSRTNVPESGPDEKEWHMYRAGAERSSFIETESPDTAAIRWTHVPLNSLDILSEKGRVLMDAECANTPPVIGYGKVVIGCGDGSVKALDLETGDLLWRSYTSGRIMSSPTIWKDRVFAGSCDGYLYAFLLKTGEELWRLRVAPQEVRVMQYEQIGSRWPVLSSPLIINGKVYSSAGMLNAIDGVYAVCADAVTGEIIWEQGDWNATSVPELGYPDAYTFSGAGQFTFGKTLYLHGGQYPVVRIDKDSGVCSSILEPIGDSMKGIKVDNFPATSKGQDIGILDSDYIMFGGRRIFCDSNEIGTWRTSITFMKTGPDGVGQLPAVKVGVTGNMPAWDEESIVFFHKSGIASISTAEFRRQLALCSDLQDTDPVWARVFDILTPGFPEWTFSNWAVRSIALTSNSVIAATGDQYRTPKLFCIDRITGDEIWNIELPDEPLRDGLAVSSDGSIIVMMRDGTFVCIINN